MTPLVWSSVGQNTAIRLQVLIRITYVNHLPYRHLKNLAEATIHGCEAPHPTNPPEVNWTLTRCFWMSAEPKGQYFHTAILQKAAPIQNELKTTLRTRKANPDSESRIQMAPIRATCPGLNFTVWLP